jgi:hypothetical protein
MDRSVTGGPRVGGSIPPLAIGPSIPKSYPVKREGNFELL